MSRDKVAWVTSNPRPRRRRRRSSWFGIASRSTSSRMADWRRAFIIIQRLALAYIIRARGDGGCRAGAPPPSRPPSARDGRLRHLIGRHGRTQADPGALADLGRERGAV